MFSKKESEWTKDLRFTASRRPFQLPFLNVLMAKQWYDVVWSHSTIWNESLQIYYLIRTTIPKKLKMSTKKSTVSHCSQTQRRGNEPNAPQFNAIFIRMGMSITEVPIQKGRLHKGASYSNGIPYLPLPSYRSYAYVTLILSVSWQILWAFSVRYSE